MNNLFDVIIIGAGPIGLTCGIEAVKRKMNYLIVEKGCLVNSIYNYPVNMTFFSTSERLEIGDVPFISHGDKPTRREALEYFRRIKTTWDLKINFYEKVNSVISETDRFRIITDKNSYQAKNIIIATGYYDNPNLLNVEGENSGKVFHYFKEAHPYSELDVAIIGGGNSAVDVALETYRRGSKVTMIVRESNLKKSIKYWVLPDIENRIKEGSIKSYFNSTVRTVLDDTIEIETPDGLIKIKNDVVFAMTGYHPDFSFLKNSGIEISPGDNLSPVFDPDTFETNRKGIYLAGVVCGGMDTGKWFIENSRFHAQSIFDHIGKSEKLK
ncbi:MAG: YpdA family putative bacillithiol disulfide reductase [Ignavibacteriales bacterium]|nr:MAG: YpdA family putative bacillithiol disulfide reductase [Ignavibacteriales bacterium]